MFSIRFYILWCFEYACPFSRVHVEQDNGQTRFEHLTAADQFKPSTYLILSTWFRSINIVTASPLKLQLYITKYVYNFTSKRILIRLIETCRKMFLQVTRRLLCVYSDAAKTGPKRGFDYWDKCYEGGSIPPPPFDRYWNSQTVSSSRRRFVSRTLNAFFKKKITRTTANRGKRISDWRSQSA